MILSESQRDNKLLLVLIRGGMEESKGGLNRGPTDQTRPKAARDGRARELCADD